MASSRPLRSAPERAKRFRALAEGTYRLADECDVPEIIEDYLRIAARLNKCAEEAEAEANAKSRAVKSERETDVDERDEPPCAHA